MFNSLLHSECTLISRNFHSCCWDVLGFFSTSYCRETSPNVPRGITISKYDKVHFVGPQGRGLLALVAR